MDNKTARKTIKTLMGAIKLNYESELDMKFSFDMYLESIGFGKPKEVIKEASEILKVYEAKDKKTSLNVQEALPLDEVSEDSILKEELDKIDILNITPIEALNKLSELKEKIK